MVFNMEVTVTVVSCDHVIITCMCDLETNGVLVMSHIYFPSLEPEKVSCPHMNVFANCKESYVTWCKLSHLQHTNFTYVIKSSVHKNDESMKQVVW